MKQPHGSGLYFVIIINNDIMGQKKNDPPQDSDVDFLPSTGCRLQVGHPSGLLNGRSDYWVERFPKFKHFGRTV